MLNAENNLNDDDLTDEEMLYQPDDDDFAEEVRQMLEFFTTNSKRVDEADIEDSFFNKPEETQAALAATWEDELTNHIEDFNTKYAQVVVGGKYKIMKEHPAGASIDGRSWYEFLDSATLKGIFTNDKIQVGVKARGNFLTPDLKNKMLAWLEHPNSNVYREGVIFSPGKKLPAGYYNTWKGFSVEPKQNASSIELILSHIKNVVCGGDVEQYEYFLNWCAFGFQFPAKKLKTAVVLRGEKRIGKGTIGQLLMKLWANHSCYINTTRQLVGTFNGHLADVCFLFADEAFFSGDKQHEGLLKSLITEDTLPIERKGIDIIHQPNYLKIFMATNSDYAVPTSGDDTRYAVFDVNSSKKGDKKYWDSIHNDIDNPEVQATFLYEMLNRDLTTWNMESVPESFGLKEQRAFSLPVVGQWIFESLEQGYFDGIPSCGCVWLEWLSTDDMYGSFNLFCDRMKKTSYDRLTKKQMGKALGKYYVSSKNKGVRGWRLGSLNGACMKFQAVEKVSMTIQAEDEENTLIKSSDRFSNFLI